MTAAVATAPAAVIATLRYRPLGDVLAAEVRVDGPHRRHEQPVDADLTLVWAERTDGTAVLAGLHLLRASQRSAGLADVLPAPIADAAVTLVARGRRGITAVDSIARRARFVIEAEVALPVAHRTAPRRRNSDTAIDTATDTANVTERPATAAVLADALRALARSVRDAHLVSDVTDPVASAVLADSLDEVALAVASGRPAPGGSAAVRAAVRGRIPLTTANRIELRSLMVALDDVDTWADTPDRLRRLSVAVAPWVVESE